MSFIPANESSFFIWFFDHYTRWSMKRRFKSVWVKQEYQPKPDSRTVYFLNHNSWWDGLIPLFLNRKFFKQQARAMMEDKQMREYSFFSKIGAFSINLKDSKSSLTSLRYALKSLQRPNSSLFIYPEGRIAPASEKRPEFKGGLAWLYSLTEEVDYVPIAIYSHSLRGSKPELYLSIGKKVNHDRTMDRNKLTSLLEQDIYHLLQDTRDVAGFSDQGFKPVKL